MRIPAGCLRHDHSRQKKARERAKAHLPFFPFCRPRALLVLGVVFVMFGVLLRSCMLASLSPCPAFGTAIFFHRPAPNTSTSSTKRMTSGNERQHSRESFSSLLQPSTSDDVTGAAVHGARSNRPPVAATLLPLVSVRIGERL